MEGLIHGLDLAQCQNWIPLVVEGDSQMVIYMAERIHNDVSYSKVLTSWSLEYRLELVEELVSRMRDLSFLHVRRVGNKVADSLANMGMKARQTCIGHAWEGLSNERLGEVSKLQVFNDKSS